MIQSYTKYIQPFTLTLIGLLFFQSCFIQKQPGTDKLNTVTVVENPTDTTSEQSPYVAHTNISSKPENPSASYWCDTLMNRSERLVVCFTKNKNGLVSADTTARLSLIDEEPIFTPQKIDTTLVYKKVYRIAVIMPFKTKTLTSLEEIHPKSLKSLEFYEGILLAVDTLKSEGHNLLVHVFDSKQDSNHVKNLLKKNELQNADLIIGPVSSSSLHIVNRFSQKNKKVLLSPFNTRSSLVKNNPYFLKLPPSFGVHAVNMVKHALALKSEKPIQYGLIAHERDSVLTKQIQEAYSIAQNNPNAEFPSYIAKSNASSIETLKPLLNKDAHNVIIIPSYKEEIFVYNTLRELNSLIDQLELRKSYDITVIGLPQWKKFKRINVQYFENLNLCFSSNIFIDKQNRQTQSFIQNYKKRYGISPREYAFIGYDLMLFSARMLKDYGISFPAHSHKHKETYLHTQFRFEPKYIKLGGTVDDTPNNLQLLYFENNYSNMVEFEEYEFQRAK